MDLITAMRERHSVRAFKNERLKVAPFPFLTT